MEDGDQQVMGLRSPASIPVAANPRNLKSVAH
jgi:hypothetical protein